jgi:hypothetical protein
MALILLLILIVATAIAFAWVVIALLADGGWGAHYDDVWGDDDAE